MACSSKPCVSTRIWRFLPLILPASYPCGSIEAPLYGMARPSPPRCPGRRVEDEAMNVDVLGIDLGKNSCSVVGLDPTGRVVLRRRMRGERMVALAAKLSR